MTIRSCPEESGRTKPASAAGRQVTETTVILVIVVLTVLLDLAAVVDLVAERQGWW